MITNKYSEYDSENGMFDMTSSSISWWNQIFMKLLVISKKFNK